MVLCPCHCAFPVACAMFHEVSLCLLRAAACRHLLLACRKGHVALIDTLRQTLVTEHFTGESTRDVVFLHNMTFHAVAQKKYVYIYDAKGTEIHVLKQHLQPNALDFLPYHFLLASVGSAGYLKYQVRATCPGVLSALVFTANCVLHACSREHRTQAPGNWSLNTVQNWEAVMYFGTIRTTLSLALATRTVRRRGVA